MRYLVLFLVAFLAYCQGCKLVAFGDSLTDNGVGVNDEHGLKRYSNGDVWPEHLGALLGCTVDDRAYSGARSGIDNIYFDGWSGGVWQADNFLETEEIQPNNIIAWECTGANDLLYHAKHDSLDPAALVPEIIINNANNLKKLLAAGATKIIIMDLFEGAAYSPYTQTDPANTPLFLQIVGAINAGIAQTVTQLKVAFPKAVIGLFITEKVWEQEIVPKFSMIDVPYNYFTPDTQFGDWKNYVWYDSRHLMNGVHEVLAKKMEEALIEAEAEREIEIKLIDVNSNL